MITPAFNATATERVLPRLALDFTTASLDPRITFTRADATATRVNSNGFIETVAANTPRFDYDPVTKAIRGLLIEEARTNLFVRSSAFISSSWQKIDAAVTSDTVTGPDGLTSGDTITASATATAHFIFQSTTSASATHTFSAYLKAGTVNFGALRIAEGTNRYGVVFDLVNGTVTATSTQNTPTGTSNSITNAGNGWYRVAITITGANPIGLISLSDVAVPASFDAAIPVFTANGTETIYAWGAQMEVGACATSIIPTVAATVLRNADMATMTGTNFSDWFNASEGAFSIVGASNGRGLGNAAMLGAVTDGTTSNTMLIGQMISNNVRTLGVTNSGVNEVLLTSQSTAFPTAIINCVGAYKLNNFAGARDGAFLQTDTTGAVPSCNQLTIGSYLGSTANQFINGWIRSIRYWPQRLTNAEVQAFSKG